MKLKLMRFISYILVLSMVLSMVPVIPVAASNAGVMTLLPNTIADWNRAKAEGKSSSYFHNQTQNEIWRKYNGKIENGELPISQLIPGGEDKGRADIWRRIETGEIYIWEVKPALHWYVESLWVDDVSQLLWYINSDSIHKIGDSFISSGGFPTTCKKYWVSYQNAQNGFIYYRFDRLDDDEDERVRDPVQVPVPEKVTVEEVAFIPVAIFVTSYVYSALIPFAKSKLRVNSVVAHLENLLIQLPLKQVSPKYALFFIGAYLGVDLSEVYADDGSFDEEEMIAFLDDALKKTLENSLNNDTIPTPTPDPNATPTPDPSATPTPDPNAPTPDPNAPTPDPNAPTPDPNAPTPNPNDTPTPTSNKERARWSWRNPFSKKVAEVGDDVNDAKTTDPIILDLDGNGIETLPLSKGVFFNHRDNDFMIRTGWVGPNNGLLVRDINGDGMINSGRELFGNHTLLRNGTEAANGFEALKDLVDEGVTVFDNTSPYWDVVKVWVDRNSNGVVDPGELMTLEEAGVLSINLNYDIIEMTDANGNIHREISAFTRTDGTIGDAVDVWFAHLARDSKAVSNLPVSEYIYSLPDIPGFGIVYSMHQAMVHDNDEQLQNLIEQFEAEKNEAVRYNIARQVVYQWTGTNTHLAALEAITGEEYVGNKNATAFAIIDRAFEKLVKAVYDSFMAQTHLWYLYDKMIPIGDEQDLVIDLTMVAYEIMNDISQNQAVGERQLLNFLRNMYDMTMIPWVDLDSLRVVLENANKKYGIVVDIADKNIIFNDGTGNLRGTQSSNIFWLDGGDNQISSGGGDNMFIFSGNLGTSNIVNSGNGNNQVVFFQNVSKGNVKVNQLINPGNPMSMNLEIAIEGVSGRVTIANFNKNSSYSLTFSDGESCDIWDLVVPIEISTADQLNNVKYNLIGIYEVVSDIDMRGINFTAIGTNNQPFNGEFYGNNQIISNLKISQPRQDYVGMFGYNKGIIKDIILHDADIAGGFYTDGVVGFNDGMADNLQMTGNYKISGKTTPNDASFTHNVTATWDGHYMVNVTVRNNGTRPLNGWFIDFRTNGDLQITWENKLLPQFGNVYTFEAMNYNSIINPGQTVNFGFIVKGNINDLNNLKLYQCRTVEISKQDVSANIRNQWWGGFTGQIVIDNPYDYPLGNWVLTFNADFEILNLWTNELVRNNDGSYSIIGTHSNIIINPKGQMVIGFDGGTKQGDVLMIRDVVFENNYDI